MKIEHWKSLTGYPEMQLDYPNLLGACMGGEGKPFPDQHCDTRKGDNELGKNPANTAHAVEALVRYDPDGTIRSNDSTFDNQLNGTLNLNCALLKNNRKAVFDAIAAWWKKERERIRRPMPRLRIERKKDEYMVEGGQLTPYCQVAVSFLNQNSGECRDGSHTPYGKSLRHCRRNGSAVARNGRQMSEKTERTVGRNRLMRATAGRSLCAMGIPGKGPPWPKLDLETPPTLFFAPASAELRAPSVRGICRAVSLV